MKIASESEVRQAIVEVYREICRLGMNIASAGNVSVRFRDGMLITPTGCTAETLRTSSVVATGFDGESRGRLKPSSEWAMHAEVYRRVPEAKAVVHAHADYCVALAALRKPIPAFHYMVQAFGGEVPCVAYHRFGSAALGAAAGMALERRTACLLANHGMLARGATLKAAFDTAVLLETLARQYLLAIAAGSAVVLSEAEMSEVAERFADYGRQPGPPARLRWQVP